MWSGERGLGAALAGRDGDLHEDRQSPRARRRPRFTRTPPTATCAPAGATRSSPGRARPTAACGSACARSEGRAWSAWGAGCRVLRKGFEAIGLTARRWRSWREVHAMRGKFDTTSVRATPPRGPRSCRVDIVTAMRERSTRSPWSSKIRRSCRLVPRHTSNSSTRSASRGQADPAPPATTRSQAARHDHPQSLDSPAPPHACGEAQARAGARRAGPAAARRHQARGPSRRWDRMVSPDGAARRVTRRPHVHPGACGDARYDGMDPRQLPRAARVGAGRARRRRSGRHDRPRQRPDREALRLQPPGAAGQSVELLVPVRFHAAHSGRRVGYAADPHTRPMGAGLELYGRRKDDSEFPVEISLSRIVTADGELISSSIRDITARKRDERDALHYLAVVESSSDAIIGKDLDGLVVSWNRGAENLYGYTEVEMRGGSISVLVPPAPRRRAARDPAARARRRARRAVRRRPRAQGRHPGRRLGDRLAGCATASPTSSGSRRSAATSASACATRSSCASSPTTTR